MTISKRGWKYTERSFWHEKKVKGLAADGRTYARDRFPLIARALSSASSPTADVYLGWSCADLIASGAIRRISPTVFLFDRTLMVMRHDAGLRECPEHDRLLYFTDDDWRGGIRDPLVPLDYRVKLSLVEARAAKRLEDRADVILVSSKTLQDAYSGMFPDKPVILIEPAWRAATSPVGRPDRPAQRIAYLGARSHMADFKFLIPIIDTVLDRRSNAYVTVSGEHPIPSSWRGNPRIEIVKPMTWRQYLVWMRGRKFDIGLYPQVGGQFNAARSENKLLEYDQFGAAVVASSRWRAAAAPASQDRCMLLNDAQNPDGYPCGSRFV
ncbi:MAG: hypothetical protein ACE5FS_09565, partial [Paracoccaceae bacterium]